MIPTLRTMTRKSKMGFGKYKDKTVQEMLDLRRNLDLISPYYKLTSINYTEDILNELNLEETIIKTFDVKEKGNSENLKQVDNIIVYIGNIFNYREKILTKPHEITEFLSKEDVNLILCDGGLKKVEFEILSQYMKKGDIIMAHDYAPNKEIFEAEYKNKIWNHMEITDKDIQKSVEKHNLKPYRMDIIKETAWVAKIKE